MESARGSFDDAAAAITRATGVKTGKRQVEELARRAAADVDAFCAARRPGPAPDEHVLVLTGDGKGIVMRPDALRPATAKAAAAGRQKLATRLSPGEKHGRKRMAELACVYDAAPAPRTPADIITPPGQEKKDRTRRPAGRREMADRLGHRRHPRRHRRCLRRSRAPRPRPPPPVDRPGGRQQDSRSTRSRPRPPAAASPCTVICDFVHVLEYTLESRLVVLR